MPPHAPPIGLKIKRRRKQLGLSQAGLARAAGISASYLNLIESNKRAIGGSLLLRIAERLQMDIEELSGRDEQRMSQAIAEMAADPLLARTGLGRADAAELVARHPEAAAALGVLYRAYADANAGMEAYASRLKSDPFLSQTLHEVLNRIAAMRSSAEILFSVPDLDEADRGRFTGTMAREAGQLTDTVRNLASYFDESSSRTKAVSPAQEVDEAIIASDNHYPALEEAAEALRRRIEAFGAFGEAAIAQALEADFGIECARWPEQRSVAWRHLFDQEEKKLWFRGSTTAATRQFQMCSVYASAAARETIAHQCSQSGVESEEAGRIARRALSSYAAGAMMMPYRPFLAEAEERRYDIDLLCHLYGASFEQVAHRLVTLRRKGAEGVPFGFLRADAAGRLTKRFPLPGLILPASGHGCLLWPVYDAFSAGGIIRQVSEFTNGNRYLLIAKAVPKRVSAFGERPLVFSLMLACDILHADRTVYGRGLDLGGDAVPVGPACRLCTRHDCGHRQENAPGADA